LFDNEKSFLTAMVGKKSM